MIHIYQHKHTCIIEEIRMTYLSDVYKGFIKLTSSHYPLERGKRIKDCNELHPLICQLRYHMMSCDQYFIVMNIIIALLQIMCLGARAPPSTLYSVESTKSSLRCRISGWHNKDMIIVTSCNNDL